MCKYGFISAGGGRYYSDPLRKLSIGDRIVAYQKGSGYVGYGIVAKTSSPIREFFVNNAPILKMPLDARGFGHDSDDLESCEYLVRIDWKETLPLSEAKFFPGAFANQNIVCRLRHPATIEFLRGIFPMDETFAPMQSAKVGFG